MYLNSCFVHYSLNTFFRTYNRLIFSYVHFEACILENHAVYYGILYIKITYDFVLIYYSLKLQIQRKTICKSQWYTLNVRFKSYYHSIPT